jgi:hypothetical protein
MRGLWGLAFAALLVVVLGLCVIAPAEAQLVPLPATGKTNGGGASKYIAAEFCTLLGALERICRKIPLS